MTTKCMLICSHHYVKIQTELFVVKSKSREDTFLFSNLKSNALNKKYWMDKTFVINKKPNSVYGFQESLSSLCFWWDSPGWMQQNYNQTIDWRIESKRGISICFLYHNQS